MRPKIKLTLRLIVPFTLTFLRLLVLQDYGRRSENVALLAWMPKPDIVPPKRLRRSRRALGWGRVHSAEGARDDLSGQETGERRAEHGRDSCRAYQERRARPGSSRSVARHGA